MEKLTIESDVLTLTTDNPELQRKVFDVYLRYKHKKDYAVTVDVKPKELSSKKKEVKEIQDKIYTILEDKADGLELKDINDALGLVGRERNRTPYHLKKMEETGMLVAKEIKTKGVSYWVWMVINDGRKT